jgi:tRNA 2-selenouridine synthase
MDLTKATVDEPNEQRPPGSWLFESSHIILDTRSPAEFEKGHITGAASFPLFDDEERAAIGTLYKQRGKDRAVEKGFEFVSPKLAGFVSRAQALFDAQSTPQPLVVHCWRGGMRSGSVAWLLEQHGISVVKLIGGYKAYRQQARLDFASIPNLRVLGGMTGVGKTQVLKSMGNKGAQVIDLEGLAGHLGSAFGNLDRIPQPSSEQFGNDCHRALSACNKNLPVWMENESRVIGRVHLPQDLFNALREAPVWAVSRTLEERVDETCRVYGEANLEALKAAFGRIREKLGGLAFREATEALDRGDLKKAAAIGLTYYDKLYLHTRARYPREHYHEVDGRGLSFEAIADRVMVEAQWA